MQRKFFKNCAKSKRFVTIRIKTNKEKIIILFFDEMSEPGKKLLELRVSDLKEELERRRLDTIGPKAALIERLEKVCEKTRTLTYLVKP